MGGDLADGQRYFFRSPCLRQRKAIPEVQGNAPSQVGQSERRLSVATVGCADEIEQRFVFRYRKQLTLAEHPSRGSEVAGEHANFSNVRLCHVFVLLS